MLIEKQFMHQLIVSMVKKKKITQQFLLFRGSLWRCKQELLLAVPLMRK